MEITSSKKKNTNETLRYLPDEIVENILSRLPVGDLLLFKTVCKSWFAMINSSNFINTHFHQSEKSNNVNLIIRQENRLILFYYAPTFDDLKRCLAEWTSSHCVHQLTLVGSCNGLLCMKRYGEFVFSIINPSTTQVKKVECKSSSKIIPRYMKCISKYYGFGYDEVIKDYKIIVLAGYMNGRLTDIFIYSFNMIYWRKELPVEIKFRGNTNNVGVFVCSCLHWVTDRNLIFGINCINEEFGLLPLSESMDSDADMYLTKFGGKLCAIYYYENSFNMWVMEDYGVKESWRKVYNLQNHEVFRLYVECGRLQYVQSPKSTNGEIPYVVMEGERLRSMVRGAHICVDSLIDVDTVIKNEQ